MPLKNLLILLITLPLFAVQIRDRLEVEEVLKPTLYEVALKVESFAKDEWVLLNTLTAVDNGVKALSLPYEGGYFWIKPVKVPDRITQTYRLEGFKGVVRYTFYLKNPKDSKRIFDLFKNISENYPITYAVEGERWVVPPKVYKREKEKLKEELLIKAKRRAKIYGKELGKDCSLRSITFSTFTPGGVYKNSVVSPKREKVRIKVSADVVFSCN